MVWKKIRDSPGPFNTPYKVWSNGKRRIVLWGLTNGRINPKGYAVKNNIKVVYKVNEKKYKSKQAALNAVKRLKKGV